VLSVSPLASTENTRSIRLLFIGWLVKLKGPYDAIKALNILVKNRSDFIFELAFIGDGPERQKLQDLVISLNLQANVAFLGWMSRSDCLSYLANSFALLHPSQGEGVSNSIMESMCLGIPVIAYPYGGTIDIIHHLHTGLLVGDEGCSPSPEQIAVLVQMLLSKPQLYFNIARQAIAYSSDHFSIDSFSESMLFNISNLQ